MTGKEEIKKDVVSAEARGFLFFFSLGRRSCCKRVSIPFSFGHFFSLAIVFLPSS
jgi:hypothetical protein